ncbi:MAG TPA: DUF2950 family protein, partial [Candidatus Acidoferrales bacterium]|nr:DUF2950 family protein [Candidatus Acidoferrales bacterium]
MIKNREALLCKSLTRELAAAIAFVAFALLLAGYVPYSFAQQQGQHTFHSPEEAGVALFAAAQNENEKALLDILGPEGRDIISSGDTAADSDERVGFVVKYEEMHRYVKAGDGTTFLYVGAENWPFPIPLLNKNGQWYFDTVAGKDEIIFRRVGKNELTAMDACRELVEAEKQYFARPPAGVTKQFAENLVSDQGRHNGLYWRGASDEFDSPIDPLIASAGQESAKSGDDTYASERIPFSGYYFRILTGQGNNAPGGARSYIVNGKMVGGFAFVAYPAEYRSSGVMTFIVNESGVV